MKYAVVLALAAAATASYLPPQEVSSAPAEVPSEPAYNEGPAPSEPAYDEGVPTDAVSEAPTDVVPTDVAPTDAAPTDVVPTDASTAAEEPTGAEEEPSYVTEVVTQYTTYCPLPTTVTDGDNVITVTEPTTLTITHCPGGCTIEKPVTKTSSVVCEDGCPEETTGAEAEPTPAPPAEEGPYQPPSNGTTGAAGPTGGLPGTGPEPTEPVTAGAAKLGAGLAAFLGVVAFF